MSKKQRDQHDDRPKKSASEQDSGFSEEELDRLQAMWVIGKQRGKERPLRNGELAVLLDNLRLRWEVLGEDEKDVLSSDDEFSKKVGVWEHGGGKEQGVWGDVAYDQKKIQVVAGMVRVLLKKTEIDFPKVSSHEAWSGLSEEAKNEGRRLLFRIKHGSSPEIFAFNVYKKMAE